VRSSSRDRTNDPPEGIEHARNFIDTSLNGAMAAVRTAFVENLAEHRSSDEAFIASVSAAADTLSAPLAGERIETTFKRDGKRITEVVNIGQRVAQFKKSVEKEEARLKQYWKQWEELQHDFVELGSAVFGDQAFGGNDAVEAKGTESGYRREMELLGLEHNSRGEELLEEIDEIGEKVLLKMRTSEKELDARARREQAKLLAAIMED